MLLGWPRTVVAGGGMSLRGSVSVAVVVLSTSVLPAAAQSVARTPRPVLQQASISSGTLLGKVRDDAGSAVSGVVVVAMGTSVLAARTDVAGRFSLALPAGEYILRANRDG